MLYTDEMIIKAHYQDFIARETYARYKEIVKESFSVVGQDLAADFLKLLSAAHSLDMPEADIFIKKLKLSDKDFCCIDDDQKKYMDLIEEERLAYYSGWDYVEA